MGLKFVSGIRGLPDPGVEVIVHCIELAPHLVGAAAQAMVDLTTQAL